MDIVDSTSPSSSLPVQTHVDAVKLLHALDALEKGDFSVRLPLEWTGVAGKVSDTFNRVVALTPTTFREEPAAFVAPDAGGPYPDGLHTLSGVGNVTLVDGKRLAFSGAEFRRVLRRMVMRRLRKLF